MKRKLIALLTALILSAAPALALPSPSSDFYILDEANVISDATEEYIIYNNDQLFDACGAQIVFAVLDDTEGEAIDDYAYDLFNEWGIGDAKKNNGFLVLMAIDDGNCYALPGTGLERALSGGAVKDLLDTYLEPDFAKKDYDAGARELFDALFREVCDASSVALTAGMPAGSSTGRVAEKASSKVSAADEPRHEARPIEEDEGDGSFLIGLIILIVILILVFGRSSRRRRRSAPPPPHVPPVHTPPPPPRRTVVRPIILPRFNPGPRPGNGPRPQPPRNHPPKSSGGAGRSSGAGRSFSAGRSSGAGRSGGFSRGGRSGGGGGSRGGGAGRGR